MKDLTGCDSILPSARLRAAAYPTFAAGERQISAVERQVTRRSKNAWALPAGKISAAWDVRSSPHRASVAFEDGRHFHDLDLRDGRDEVLHLCGSDRYAGAFIANDADSWSVRWCVVGPHKALVIEGHYSRR